MSKLDHTPIRSTLVCPKCFCLMTPCVRVAWEVKAGVTHLHVCDTCGIMAREKEYGSTEWRGVGFIRRLLLSL